ncbi:MULTISPECIES: hypothetical protein [unclassified Haladaptatus]|uniref:hypothetical protein n=1 Tax=unclassified Haladaptatus TaxID=2622732 RepID=UPI0023E8580E|nr:MULTISPECIES: hypothetical protein [unclassified Haladaptatus]
MYSWKVGPKESLLVRGLLYVASGLLPAYLIVLGVNILTIGVFSPEILAIGALIGVLFSLLLTRTILALRHSPTHWILTEFRKVMNPILFGVSTVLATVSLGALFQWGISIHIAFFVLCFTSFWLAGLLSSQGSIDPHEQTLSFVTHTHHEIALDSIRKRRQLVIGNRSYNVLTFQRDDDVLVDRVLMIPTDILPQMASLLATENATPARSPLSKTSISVLLAGLLVFGTLGIGFSIIVYLGSGSVIGAILISAVLFGFVLFYFLLAHFTNFLSSTSAK